MIAYMPRADEGAGAAPRARRKEPGLPFAYWRMTGWLLSVNIAHLAEHYGNMVTYLRLKKIVPPSTEAIQRQMKKP